MVSRKRITLAAAALAAMAIAVGPAAAADRALAESGGRVDVVRGDLEAGIAAVKHGDWSLARVYLQRAIDRDPQDPDALAAMGETFLRLGQRDSALQYTEAALIVEPDHRNALATMGEIYLSLGKLPEARHKAFQLAEQCPQGCAERTRLDEAIAVRTGAHGGT